MSKRLKELLSKTHNVEVVDWADFNISVKPFKIYNKGKEVSQGPDLVITMSKIFTRNTHSEIDMIYSTLKILEQNNIICLNPIESTKDTINKLVASNFLNNHNIPIPETGIVSSSSDLALYLEDWKEVVVKPIYGHGSLDVHRITKKNIWPDAVTPINPFEEILIWDLIKKHGLILVQKFIQKIGREFRIQVVDGVAVSAFEKVGTEDRWKAVTYIQEASTAPFKFDEETGRIAEKSIQALGLNWGCVDMVYSKDGPIILEVNPSFNFWEGYEKNSYTIGSITFENILVEFIKDKLK